jgi:ribosome-binding protein aMBF1 (putative translation factor)
MISTGRQISAARALIGWSQDDLASACALNRNSIVWWERKPVIPTGKYRVPHAVERIEKALAMVGVRIVTRPAPGVYLRQRPNG